MHLIPFFCKKQSSIYKYNHKYLKMRAKEYVEINKGSIEYLDEIIRVINDLLPIRNDKNKTEEYYKNKLTADKRYSLYNDTKFNNGAVISNPSLFNPIEGEVEHKIAANFRNQLFYVVQKDKSFGYIYYLLAREINGSDPYYRVNPIDCVPKKDIITQAIQDYQDDYISKIDINEFLQSERNKNYYLQDNSREDESWFDFFKKAYYLFDELRVRMNKPTEALKFLQQYKFNKEQESDRYEILRFVTDLLRDYEYDITSEQQTQKEIIENRLGTYLKKLSQDSQLKEDIQTTDYDTTIDQRIEELCKELADKKKEIEDLNARIKQLSTPLEPLYEEAEMNTSRTMKVTTDVMVEILGKLGINQNTADKTKMAKLISCITGYSMNTVRLRLTNREELTKSHKNEVEKINKILHDINASLLIKYNKKR